jgi:hypothetical protein
MPKGTSKNPEETKRKLSISHLGIPPWNKGVSYMPKSGFKKGEDSFMKGKHHTEEAKNKNREKHLGKKHPNRKKPPIFTEEHRKNISKGLLGKSNRNKGKKLSAELRRQLSEVQKKRVKEGKHNNYKGGITPINHIIREGIEMRLWREAVFARDNWTCQKTMIKGGRIVAHHIQNFADFLEGRTSIENGITLSRESHKEFHRRYGYKNTSREQLEEYLNR